MWVNVCVHACFVFFIGFLYFSGWMSQSHSMTLEMWSCEKAESWDWVSNLRMTIHRFQRQLLPSAYQEYFWMCTCVLMITHYLLGLAGKCYGTSGGYLTKKADCVGNWGIGHFQRRDILNWYLSFLATFYPTDLTYRRKKKAPTLIFI